MHEHVTQQPLCGGASGVLAVVNAALWDVSRDGVEWSAAVGGGPPTQSVQHDATAVVARHHMGRCSAAAVPSTSVPSSACSLALQSLLGATQNLSRWLCRESEVTWSNCACV